MTAPPGLPRSPACTYESRIRLAGVDLDRLTEREVVGRVTAALSDSQGGWIVTPNIDICRGARHDQALADLVAGASLAVADGMPLVWAARLNGTPLPGRVAGAALIYSLSEAAAAQGHSIYLLGGAPGVAEEAGRALARRYPDLKVAGTDAPPFGFDATQAGIEAVREKLLIAPPDIVFVGLGFPKQERLISILSPGLPGVWFVACGAAIPFAAGAMPRAPRWMQQTGLEWIFRLAMEPRRMFRRYLVRGLPFAARLLAAVAWQRLWRQRSAR